MSGESAVTPGWSSYAPAAAPAATAHDAFGLQLVGGGDGTGARQRSRRKAYLVGWYLPLDAAAALAALFVVFAGLHADALPHALGEVLGLRITLQDVLLLGVFTTLWSAALRACGLYDPRRLPNHRAELARLAAGCTLGAAAAFLFPLTSAAAEFPAGAVPVFWAVALAALVVVRLGVKIVARLTRQHETTRTIIVGSGPRARALWRRLRADPLMTYDVLGFVDAPGAVHDEMIAGQMLGSPAELEGIVMRTVVDEVLIALPIKSCYADIERAIRVCERAGVRSKYLVDAFVPALARPRVEHSGEVPVMSMRVVQDDYRLLVKRAVDVAGAAAGLVVLTPLLLAIAVAVKLSGPGPVFFAQERYGLGKRRFRMYKFRTMVPNAEALLQQLESQNDAQGPVFKMKRDPRITPVGRVLRKTSLDELPQLLNVLKGEMSLVGPRPLPLRDVGRFGEPWLMRRFSVRPGLTCLWQVGGRSDVAFDQWVALDLRYIDEWSLGLDLHILLRTVPAVLKGAGAA
jgi:exopolysaccharide biosynthesis polyprenyl glycosylphosphotransferase